MQISLQNAIVLIAGQSFITGVFGDFSGPSFPAPKDLTSNNSLFKAAWEDVTAALEANLAGNSSYGNYSLSQETRNLTFSIGLFSIQDPDAATLQFHHTSPEIAASTQGTNKVDENSIYRVASVTKVFTVLAGLLSLSDAEWDRPLSDILAPLSGGSTGNGDSVLTTHWDMITMRALAAQQGGVPRDGFPNLGEVALQLVLANISEVSLMASTGLPPYNASDPLSAPPCLDLLLQGKECTATPYLEGVANRAPTFSPWSASPAYANTGFVLLGLAMANVTGRSIAELYQENILDPLGMSSTFADPPPIADTARSVIVDSEAANFNTPNGIFVSSGGVFSSMTDLARFGSGILNSSLLPPEQTSRWLKPVSFTARLPYAVGAPWEIIRFRHSDSNKITDMYTKLGDSGSYSSWLVLLPEYGAGFSILSAAGSSAVQDRFGIVGALVDLVSGAMVPALQAQAALEAGINLGGTYTPAAADGLNSTLVLKTESNTPGLIIDKWVSNGTDVLSSPFLKRVAGPGPYRLLPSVGNGGDGQMAFRLVSTLDSPASSGQESGALFAGPGMVTADWLVVDASTYYGVGLSLFVFDLGQDGKATAVRLPAYRVKLPREV
ncbi:Beta-lactamase/transpeptidase-like protein [Naviculisporaceae sp. PSN 640]